MIVLNFPFCFSIFFQCFTMDIYCKSGKKNYFRFFKRKDRSPGRCAHTEIRECCLHHTLPNPVLSFRAFFSCWSLRVYISGFIDSFKDKEIEAQGGDRAVTDAGQTEPWSCKSVLSPPHPVTFSSRHAMAVCLPFPPRPPLHSSTL